MVKSVYIDDLHIAATPTALVGGGPNSANAAIDFDEGGTVTDLAVRVFPVTRQIKYAVFVATDFAGAFVLDGNLFPRDPQNPQSQSFPFSGLTQYPTLYHPFSANPNWGTSRPRVLSFSLAAGGPACFI